MTSAAGEREVFSSESELLDAVIPGLEAEGYTVFVRPSPSLVPTFIGDFVPDAIALGKPKNLVIEVLREGRPSDKKIADLRRRFVDKDDWELRVYYARPATSGASLATVSKSTIEGSLASIDALVTTGQTSAALLMAWATFEALGRATLPGQFLRPQTPTRLIEVLSFNGHITPSEADLLYGLADDRNRLIHGGLEDPPKQENVRRFADVLRTLVGLLPAGG